MPIRMISSALEKKHLSFSTMVDDLDALRYKRFQEKVESFNNYVDAKDLPPTFNISQVPLPQGTFKSGGEKLDI